MRQQNLCCWLHFAAPTCRGESKFSVAWGCVVLQRPTPNHKAVKEENLGDCRRGYETVGASEEYCFESRTRRARGGRKVLEREGLSSAKMLRRLRLPSAVLRGLLTSKLKAST